MVSRDAAYTCISLRILPASDLLFYLAVALLAVPMDPSLHILPSVSLFWSYTRASHIGR